ncbi:DNA-3-methyladenine glycosylase family protein [Nonomuraea sp. NPDC050451]|uniref:DNA-3-methyladenine glycosylase family protein n=1 Tax=Nonomuraea sp. NPDC050451 TaxID=3364364 RepID=UPI0037AA5F1F
MILTPREPFDFAASLAFLRRFPPTSGEQRLTAGTLTKAFRVAGQTVLARVTATEAGLELTPGLDALADRVRFHLSLDDDLSPFYARADERFAQVVSRLRGYHQVKFPSPLENLVWAILCQRTPMSVASRAKAALVGHVGNEHGAFPDLDQLLAVPEERLTALVGDPRKGVRLHAALRGWAEVSEPFLRDGPYEEVKGFLLGLPGIGPWSANFILIRGLGRMDEAPIDKELKSSVQRVYGRAYGEPELRALAERYGPWQGYWAHYLRVAASATV